MVHRIYVFLCIVCTVLFNLYLLILEKLATWAYLMSLGGNCGKSSQTNLMFCMMLTVGVVLCMSGQYLAFSLLPGTITARRSGMLATRRHRRSTGISAYVSSRICRSLPRCWGRLSMQVIALPNSSQICSMGLQSGNLAGCTILETLPRWRQLRTTQAQGYVALSSWPW